MKIKKISISECIELILLFLACINVGQKGSVVCIVLGFFAFLRHRFSLKISKEFFVFFLLSGLIGIFALIHEGISEAIKATNFTLMFMAGYAALINRKDKKTSLHHYCFIIFFAFVVYNFLFWRHNHGFVSGRQLYNIWKDELVSVTLVGLLAAPVVGYSFYVFFASRSRLLKIFTILALGVVCSLNLETATRTPFVIFVIVYFFLLASQISELNFKKVLKIYFLAGLLIVTGFICYEKNIGNLQTIIQNSTLHSRVLYESFHTSRWDFAWKHLERMPLSLFGGSYISADIGMPAHNYLQEGYDRFGIFVLLCLLIITFFIFRRIFFLFTKRNKQPEDLLFLGLYTAIFLQICAEPVFSGFPILLYILCFIHGLDLAYYKQERLTCQP